MKIVCGSCGAKYSIADEKVQGKVFKIRCRKCSNVIVVKGTEDEADVEASSMSSSSGAQEWYVVIDGEQSGPMNVSEVESAFIQGRINAQSYTWRDGMPDWTPLVQVDAFAHLGGNAQGENEMTTVAQSPLLQSGQHVALDEDEGEDATAVVDVDGFRQQLQAPAPQAPRSPSYGGGAAVASEGAYDGGYGGGYDQGAAAMSFGQEAAPSYDSGGYNGAMSSFDGGDEPSDGVFANFDTQSSGGGGLAYQSFSGLGGASEMDFGGSAVPAPSSARVSTGGNDNLIGQRNDNSVLFSLSSLQQVKAVSSDNAPSAEGGGDNTDGSGLIDIRALASTHKSLKSDSASDPFGGGGAASETFAPTTMSVPAIMPTRGTHRNNTGLLIGVLIAVVVLVGGGVAAAVILTKPTEQQPQVIVQKEVIREVVKDNSADRAAAEAAASAAAAAPKTPEPEEEAPEDEGDDKGKSSKSRTSVASRSKPDPKPDPTPEPSKPAPSKKSQDGIDSILGQIDSGKSNSGSKPAAKDPEPAAASSNVPAKLSKPQVQGTFGKYSGQFAGCAKNQNSGNLSGTLWVRLKIEPSGSVSSADVDSKSPSFKGTDVGRCAAGVAKGMRFPEAKSDLSLAYPVRL